MQLVAAGHGLGEQMLVVQVLQATAGDVQGGAVERGGRVGVEVGSWMQAEPAEQPLQVFGEVVVGKAERGRYRQVLGAHHGEPVPRAGQVGGQVSGGPGGMVAQLAGEHPDGQRQVPAQPGDLTHRGIGGADPGPGSQPGQQRRRLRGRQRVQADHGGVVQRGQPPPAGDQHQAARGPRQQRPHLLMPGRIIQYQQDLCARHLITPACRPGFEPGRDLSRGHPRGQQQAGQRVGRVDRPLPRGVGVQRQEELAVREGPGQPVRGVHREGGLADPGHPVDRVDAHYPAASRHGGQRPH